MPRPPHRRRPDSSPLPLRAGLAFCVLTQADIPEVAVFLDANYVADGHRALRPGVAFVHWWMSAPGRPDDWFIGLRDEDGELVGTVAAVPSISSLDGVVVPMARVSLLAVHASVRDGLLGRVLIQEIRRRIERTDRWHALFTSSWRFRRPLFSAAVHIRPLDAETLAEVGLIEGPPRRAARDWDLGPCPVIDGFREMQPTDIGAVVRLLERAFDSSRIHPVLSEEDVAHWLLPRRGLSAAWVVDRGGLVALTSAWYAELTIGDAWHPTLKLATQSVFAPGSVDPRALLHRTWHALDAHVHHLVGSGGLVQPPGRTLEAARSLHYYIFDGPTGRQPSELVGRLPQ